MIYRKSSVDIIGEVVAAMEFNVGINSVTEIESGVFMLDVCEVYHAQKSFSVTIGGNEYKIKSVTYPNILIVTGTEPITVNNFELYHPYFFHGTPLSTGIELDKKKKAGDKIPMVWLLEQFTDTFDTSTTDPIERRIKLQLFFLSVGNPAEWQTAQAYEFGIKPMARLQEKFQEQLVTMNWLFSTDDFSFTVLNYHQFGVYIVNKGMPEQLWVEKLSGVEMNISELKVYADGLCRFPECTPMQIPNPEPQRSFDNSFDNSFL